MKVAGYVRVSTQEQAEEGYSISEQTERLEMYCNAKGWTLAKVYTDGGYSGAKLKRPALQQLIADCKQYEMILVYKLDRLSRSQKDTLYLIEDVFKKNDINFTSMQENFDTSTPLGMAMVGILSVFAQLEREQIKERMMMGKNGRAKEGYWMYSVPPIGYNYIIGNGKEKGHLEINETEAEQVREIYHLYLAGTSKRQIMLHMSHTYSNRMYSSISTISKILRNPVYYGVMQWGGELIQGQHEPIIDHDTFEQAQLITNASKKTNIGKAKHLLTGLVRCGVCGDVMVYKTTTKSNGKRYHYYACRTFSKMNDRLVDCNNKAIRAEKLEEAVLNEVKKIKMKPPTRLMPKDNSKQIAAIERQIERAMQLYTIENVDLASIKRIIADLNEKKSALQAQNAAKSSENAAKIVLQSFDDIFIMGDQNAKIAALRSIIKQVSVKHEQIDIHFNF